MTNLHTDVDVILDGDLADVAGTQHRLREQGGRRCGGEGVRDAVAAVALPRARARRVPDEETFPAADFYGMTVTEVMGHTVQTMRGEEHRLNRARSCRLRSANGSCR